MRLTFTSKSPGLVRSCRRTGLQSNTLGRPKGWWYARISQHQWPYSQMLGQLGGPVNVRLNINSRTEYMNAQCGRSCNQLAVIGMYVLTRSAATPRPSSWNNNLHVSRAAFGMDHMHHVSLPQDSGKVIVLLVLGICGRWASQIDHHCTVSRMLPSMPQHPIKQISVDRFWRHRIGTEMGLSAAMLR